MQLGIYIPCALKLVAERINNKPRKFVRILISCWNKIKLNHKVKLAGHWWQCLVRFHMHGV